MLHMCMFSKHMVPSRRSNAVIVILSLQIARKIKCTSYRGVEVMFIRSVNPTCIPSVTCHKCFTSRVLVGPDDTVHRVHAANKQKDPHDAHNDILPRLSGIWGMLSGMCLKGGGINGEREKGGGGGQRRVEGGRGEMREER